jgi:hypothetical protein
MCRFNQSFASAAAAEMMIPSQIDASRSGFNKKLDLSFLKLGHKSNSAMDQNDDLPKVVTPSEVP